MRGKLTGLFGGWGSRVKVWMKHQFTNSPSAVRRGIEVTARTREY